MRRELRSATTEQALGSVADGGVFEGAAGNVLRGLRRELGDVGAAERVLAEGWSNGYLYFGDLMS